MTAMSLIPRSYLWVVDESTALAIWWLVSSGGIFETLDDSLVCISNDLSSTQ